MRTEHNMFTACLYNLLWQLIHLLALTIRTLSWLSLRLQALLTWSYDQIHTRAWIEQRDRKFLEHCKTELTKKPQHLSIIIGPDNTQVDEKTFVRLLTYALIVDINCVSLYDTRQTNEGRISLEKLQKLTPKSLECEVLGERHIQWSLRSAPKVHTSKNGISNTSLTNGSALNFITTNGNGRKQKEVNQYMQIYQIVEDDGYAMLAEICRELFRERLSPEVQDLLKETTHLTQRIDAELKKRLFSNFSDPDVCIIFSHTTCTFGMLPWQTRFTEFHTHEPGCAVTVQTFAKVLYRFSRCEQRWGK